MATFEGWTPEEKARIAAADRERYGTYEDWHGGGAAPAAVRPPQTAAGGPDALQDVEAEQDVVGALLLDPGRLVEVVGVVQPDDFTRERMRYALRAMVELDGRGDPIDYATVRDQMERAGVTVERSELFELQDRTPTAVNVEHYARRVKECSIRRAGSRAAQLAAQRFQDPVLDVDETIGFMGQAATELACDGPAELQSAGELLPAVMRMIEQRREGLSSGLRELDRYTGGFEPGELILVAARPSMGKSALAMGFALHAAMRAGRPAAIFSLEMSKELVLERFLAAAADVDLQRLRRRLLGEQEWERLSAAAGPLGNAPLLIEDGQVDEVRIAALAQRAKQRHGDLGLVVVDYVQLMTSREQRREVNRVQELSTISRALKALAVKLQVPVVLVSQLNRLSEGRPDRRPHLSDLRDSGALEQDADKVILLFRSDYYELQAGKRPEELTRPGIAELIVAKSRNGETGVVEAYFRPHTTTFHDLDRREAQP